MRVIAYIVFNALCLDTVHCENSTYVESTFESFYSCYFGKHFKLEPASLPLSLRDVVSDKVADSLESNEKVKFSICCLYLGK
jgi:hypothetical protein